MQEAVSNLRKAKALYVQRQQEWERAKDAAQRAENGADSSADQAAKLDKRKKTEEDALQKVCSSFFFFLIYSVRDERKSRLVDIARARRLGVGAFCYF